MPFRNTARLAAVALGMLAPSLALAASIIVNTADDEVNGDGDCSLREAIASANLNMQFDDCNRGDAGADTIVILVNGTISVANKILVSEALVLQGAGTSITILDGGGQSRHFLVDMPDNTHDFSISDLTLQGGRSDETDEPGQLRGGGSVRVLQVGTLSIDGVRFLDNRAESSSPEVSDVLGGAILFSVPADNGSTLEIRGSVFDGNESQAGGGAVNIPPAGGGMPGTGLLVIERTRFVANQAAGSGGALSAFIGSYSILDSVFEGNITASDTCCGPGGGAFLRSAEGALNLIERTTFLDNTARDEGGAIYLDGGNNLIRNATFHGNGAVFGGQAIDLRQGALAALFFSTLYDNGNGVASDESIRVCADCSLSLAHSIVGASWAPDNDCRSLGGSITSNGHNIDSSGTCTSEPSDLPMTDPQLPPPGDHGDSAPGLVIPTLLPQPGSPAIDGGASTCPGPFGGTTAQDQRSQPRPVSGPEGNGALCDIGAVEVQPADDPTIFADRFESTP